MKKTLAALSATTALSVPQETSGLIMDIDGCGVINFSDPTPASNCKTEMRPRNQSGPEGLLASTRLRLTECESAEIVTNDTGHLVLGDGAEACARASSEEINAELEYYKNKCRVAYEAIDGVPDAYHITAKCE